MSCKYIEMSFRVAVDPDKVDAVLWYLGQHLDDFCRVSGPNQWVEGGPDILGYTVDGNDYESPRYDI